MFRRQSNRSVRTVHQRACQLTSSRSRDDHEDGGPTIQLPAADSPAAPFDLLAQNSIRAREGEQRQSGGGVVSGGLLRPGQASCGSRWQRDRRIVSQPGMAACWCSRFLPRQFGISVRSKHGLAGHGVYFTAVACADGASPSGRAGATRRVGVRSSPCANLEAGGTQRNSAAARNQASSCGLRARGGRVRTSVAPFRSPSCCAATGPRSRCRRHVPVPRGRSATRLVAMVRYRACGCCLSGPCATARRRDAAARAVFVGLRSRPRSLGTIDSGACDSCARRVWPTIVAESRRPAAGGHSTTADSHAAARGRDHGHSWRHPPGQRHPARRRRY